MCNHNRDNKSDENFIDKLVQVLNWYSTQTQAKSKKPTAIVWDIDRREMRGSLGTTARIVAVHLASDSSKALICQKDIVAL